MSSDDDEPALHDATTRPVAPRILAVPAVARGMRLDRFLSRWFPNYSRSALARSIREGTVTEADGRIIRASSTVRDGQELRIWIPGIAPLGPPPPFPPILHEDDRLVVLDKPAGLLVHPAGNDYAWAAVSLAKERWPGVDLVHRLDRDTSGVLLLSKDADANRFLKAAFHDRATEKIYEAIAVGTAPFERFEIDAPIGPATGPIRIQMAIRPDGLPSRTDVTVLDRRADPHWTRIRLHLHTGRTHQIRVHMDHIGLPLLGDRMYGLPAEVFLRAWEQGVDDETIRAAGAPRHALHAARLVIPHPNGGTLSTESAFPADLQRWWEHPEVLPFDRP